MNEQRKVIYKRRQQILDGGDLREESIEAIEGAIDHVGHRRDWRRASSPRTGTSTSCSCRPQDVFPTRVTREQLDELAELAKRCSSCCTATRSSSTRRRKTRSAPSTLREIERRVMLSVIDQHWREHLYEMDYLREGINLRAMGQRDPLAEWQREGFDMFEAMMERHQGRLRPLHLPARGRRRRRRPRPVARTCSTPRPRTRCRASGGFAAAAASRPPIEELGGRGAGPTSSRRPAAASRCGVEKTPGPQRALLLRERQEVQALPRALTPRRRLAMRDFTDDLAELRTSASTRRARVPAASTTQRARLAELEAEAAQPDLWDDQDAAAQGHDRARRRPRRRRARRRARRAASTTSRRSTELGREEGDDSVEPEIDAGARRRSRGELDRLELRALFTGEHDERDAICQVSSGAGGTDAQDWTEMLLRMFTRWAERGASRSRSTRSARAPRPGISSATFTVQGSLRVRAAHRREGRAPAHPHLAVRRATRAARPRSPRSTRCPRSTQAEAPEIDAERPAHRHLPVVGRGRPARERDRLRGAHHAPARPASSCRARTSARSCRTRRRRCRSSRRASREQQREEQRAELEQLSGEKRDVDVRQPDPHLHAAAVPAGEGRAHPLRDRQRAGGARRRPRRASSRPSSSGGRAAGRQPALVGRSRTCRRVVVPVTRFATGPAVSLDRSHDSLRERHQDLQGRGRRAARRQPSTSQKGEFVFLVGPVGLGEVHLPPPAAARGDADAGPHRRRRPRHHPAHATGRSRSCAATSAASSRTTSCCRTRPSTRTWRSPPR